MFLLIETSTNICSVALCEGNVIVAERTDNGGRSHASLLTCLIEDVLKETSIKASDLEAVVVSKGAGSYTGLRIGVSVAKGIAFGAAIPIIGIETTLSMFFGFKELFNNKYTFTEEDIFVPVIDARRMEVYCAAFAFDSKMVRPTFAEILTPTSFQDILPSSGRLFIFGDAAKKCTNIFSDKQIIVEEEYSVSASSLRTPACRAFNEKLFEDTAYFEPFYLKEFVATKPTNKIF